VAVTVLADVLFLLSALLLLVLGGLVVYYGWIKQD
jgi:hypothetical protein